MTSQDTQREYFRLLDEYFRRTTRQSASQFASSTAEFEARVRQNAESIGTQQYYATLWFQEQVADFYNHVRMNTFQAAKDLGGLKFVLGGSTQFRESHFRSVVKLALYADTILIADPVLPWFEVERPEERFRHVLLLRDVFSLLRLKPLVDAQLAYPAIHVFQSWEKSLQERDLQTLDGIAKLTAGVVGIHIGASFDTFDDLRRFATSRPDEFLRGVQEHQLFVAPGMSPNEPIKRQIESFMSHQRQWRTGDYVEHLERCGPSDRVLAGLLERMTHQYHLFENSDELHANPLLAVEQQWHYYKLSARAVEHKLQERGVISSDAIKLVRGLHQPSLSWLGNVPVEDLARLREANENEEFRRKLDGFVAELHGAAADDLDRIAAQIGRAVASLIAEHQREIATIRDRYRVAHAKTAMGAWISAAAAYLPLLGPYVASAAPLALLGNYAWDKFNEHRDMKRASKSLMGVFARVREDA